MKTKNKALLLTLCAMLLVAASIFGTVAYLTAEDEVVNTFTVGNVSITLDEAKVNPDGTPVANAARVKENGYKLIPGKTYTKDPMVTVGEGSENAYIKMTVSISKSAALDAIFAPGGADLTSIFNGYDPANWIYKGSTVQDDVRTYEFWYKEAAGAGALDPLFDSFTVPGTITNEQLAAIEGMTMTVKAYAIQADGFADAGAAWTEFAK